ncbi:putative Myosin XI [Zostera marina]|uniref:Putative Myosin XI n=1 Tax=Zostera marina TaxID=29655 RepID=A0A0K9NSZ7_ZOSMR|nr:putative Myosin XI [Zostera marina]
MDVVEAALDDLQLQVEETNSLLIRDREAPVQVINSHGAFQSFDDDRRIYHLQKSLQWMEEKISSLQSDNQENQDLLIKCISGGIGSFDGTPMAASVMYKCLLLWRSSEGESTANFDRIMHAMYSAIVVGEKSSTVLSYWLANSSTLLLLLERTVKASRVEAGSISSPQSRIWTTLFGGISRGHHSSVQTPGISILNGQMVGLKDTKLVKIEPDYPALIYSKQQLVAFIGKIYGMIRDNLKGEISPFIASCIEAPKTTYASLVQGSRSQLCTATQPTLVGHWKSIVKILNDYLKTLRENSVSPYLVRKLFKQIFSFINVQLFNSLLLQRECCSLSNCKFVKLGLAELDQWCYDATDEYAASCWEELEHTRQAIGFLPIIPETPDISLKEIENELCQDLNIQQLYRISTMYYDDNDPESTASSKIISSMKTRMAEDDSDDVNNIDGSFLLGDDISIPFSEDDISKYMTLMVREIDISNVDPPLIRRNTEFVFLLQPSE